MKQSVFAKLVGTSRSTISRAVKSGILKGYGKDHEVIEEEALFALRKVGKVDKEGKYVSRQSKPFEGKHALTQDSKEALLNYEGEIESSAMSREEMKALADKQHEDMKNNPSKVIDIEEEEISFRPIPDDLSLLLAGMEDPSKRVVIIEDFWAGKIQKQKFLREKSELISTSEAKGVLEIFLTPLSQAMEDLPYKMKAKFPDIENSAIEWLIDYTNSVKEETQHATF